jgi:negative regulator of sigma E activity
VYRRTAGIATVALVAVIALALAAATLPSPVLVEDDGSVGDGTGSGVGRGTGDGAGTAGGGFDRPEWLAPLIAATFALLRVLGTLAVLLLLALLIYVTVTRREALLEALRDLLGRVPSAIAQVTVLAVVVLALLVLFSEGSVPKSAPVVPFAGEGGGDTSSATSLSPAPITTLAVVVGLAVVSVLTLWGVRSRFRRQSTAEEPAVEESDVDTTEIGQAAGQAADQLESDEASADAVLAAWREMATLVAGRDRRTVTPRQVTARAIAAGCDPDDVETLTRLFEDVRYGDVALSEAQRQRALRAFRRIETVAGEDGA